MDFFRRFLERFTSREPGPPPDQASTAPLDPDTVPDIRAQEVYRHISSGAAQSIGNEREKNDDSLIVLSGSVESSEELPDFGLFCVADGLGGYEHGEDASATCVRSIARSLTRGAILEFLTPETDTQSRPIQEMVRVAVEVANQDVRERAEGGATTLTAALLLGNQVTIGHVGDTRAYLIIEDTVEQLTRDHSLVQQLIETGTITEEEAVNHPKRNVLWNALGRSVDIKVDVSSHNVPPNSFLLLCSDGLWGVLPETEIQQIIRSVSDPQIACEDLVSAANEAGGPDNVTVILVRFPPEHVNQSLEPNSL